MRKTVLVLTALAVVAGAPSVLIAAVQAPVIEVASVSPLLGGVCTTPELVPIAAAQSGVAASSARTGVESSSGSTQRGNSCINARAKAEGAAKENCSSQRYSLGKCQCVNNPLNDGTPNWSCSVRWTCQ